MLFSGLQVGWQRETHTYRHTHFPLTLPGQNMSSTKGMCRLQRLTAGLDRPKDHAITVVSMYSSIIRQKERDFLSCAITVTSTVMKDNDSLF